MVVDRPAEPGSEMAIRAVVEKAPAIPIPAVEPYAKIPEAIINATVVTHVPAPVPGMPEVPAATPAPPTRRPKRLLVRGQHPRAIHPVVLRSIPRPIPRRPDIPVTRAKRLVVGRNRRRGNPRLDRHTHLGVHSRRNRRKSCKQSSAKSHIPNRALEIHKFHQIHPSSSAIAENLLTAASGGPVLSPALAGTTPQSVRHKRPSEVALPSCLPSQRPVTRRSQPRRSLPNSTRRHLHQGLGGAVLAFGPVNSAFGHITCTPSLVSTSCVISTSHAVDTSEYASSRERCG